MKVKWVEVDVQLTSDGIPVLMHDHKLERTTNGKGLIDQKKWSYLKHLDAGSWFHHQFHGECIPTLSAAVKEFKNLSLGCNIEIKSLPGRGYETCEAALKVLSKFSNSYSRKILLSSLDTDALSAAREQAENIPRAYIVDGDTDDILLTLSEFKCEAVHCNYKFINPDFIREITRAGFKIRCFTVNDSEKANRLFDWGITGVFSDFPDKILGTQ